MAPYRGRISRSIKPTSNTSYLPNPERSEQLSILLHSDVRFTAKICGHSVQRQLLQLLPPGDKPNLDKLLEMAAKLTKRRNGLVIALAQAGYAICLWEPSAMLV